MIKKRRNRFRRFGHTRNILGFVDDRRKSSGNMLKSLEILENLKAICGANIGNLRGVVDHDWKIIGNVLDALEAHRESSGFCQPPFDIIRKHAEILRSPWKY